jgi:hypothetical protein
MMMLSMFSCRILWGVLLTSSLEELAGVRPGFSCYFTLAGRWLEFTGGDDAGVTKTLFSAWVAFQRARSRRYS